MQRSHDTSEPQSEADRARDTLLLGILAFRWGALAWMTSLAVTSDPFRRPVLAWVSVAVAIAWTTWLTVRQRDEGAIRHGVDLTVAVFLVLVSGLVVGEREVLGGRPFFATAYPVAAALSWGAAFGLPGGLFAGALLGVALGVSRTLNGVPFEVLTAAQHRVGIINGGMAYLLAGGAMGLVKRLLDRTADQFREVNEAAVRERERAARLAERESLAREIHDSVLQALSLVHKRGRELSEQDAVSGGEVRALAELARDQETALRGLILREPEGPPAGRASLRDALERAAGDVDEVPVQVSATGPMWLARHTVEELVAAVREALANVARHAHAKRAAVFAEEVDNDVVVTVRDDGDGFILDEERLRREEKAGLLKSMKGRAEALGGSMRVETAPGRGTEVEFRIPRRTL